MENKYQIIRASNGNIEQIQQLIFQVMDEYGIAPKKKTVDTDLLDIEESYKDGFFGVLQNEQLEIIGTLGLFKLEEGVFEIRKMYLLPAYRGKGLGKKMFNYLLDEATKRDYKRVQLETASVLKEAIGLYLKLGFQEIKNENQTSACDRAFFMDRENVNRL